METDTIRYLKLMIAKGASAAMFSVGTAPHMRVKGAVERIDGPVLDAGDVHQLAYGIMTAKQIEQFEAEMTLNFSLSVRDVGRFRVNVYRQRGAVAMVIRHVHLRVPSAAQLALPPIVEQLALSARGLVLVVGTTGSGKSTTLAAMVDCRNERVASHIVCIEDPIEYLHEHGKSVVDQREIGLDVPSMSAALANAIHEAPDVVAIGEIRDAETMQHAIAFADTGRLCLGTLRAANAAQALERITAFYADEARRRLLLDLSINLAAVVSQKLVAGQDGRPVPAVEVLLMTPFVADLVKMGRVDDLRTAVARGSDTGMVSFDQSLLALYEAGRISMDEALRNADSQTELKMRIRLTQPLTAEESALRTIIDPTGHGSRK